MNNETITVEDRLYVNPEVSMAEQDAFMERFQALQAQNQAQINQDTYSLGTPVSSNLGGLTGAEGLWNAQYTRPAVSAAIENLRQVNIQQALNTAMQNQQNAIADRLNQTKRAYYRAQQEATKRDRDRVSSDGKDSDKKQGGVNVEGLLEGKGTSSLQSNAPGTSTLLSPSGALGENIGASDDVIVKDTATGEILWGSNKGPTTTKNDYSLWDINNPFSWGSWLLGLAGASQKVKR